LSTNTPMDIRQLILKQLKTKKTITTADIMKVTGFSREYIGRFLRAFQKEGIIALVGKANQARYVAAQPGKINAARRQILQTKLVLRNKNLSEDVILERLKRETGIWLRLPANVVAMLDYGFTEMMNNAIEHSRSKVIIVEIQRDAKQVVFEVADQGVGIFNNIRQQRKLHTTDEAIEDLMKGKQTTMPKAHSGEGIFFSSKAADTLTIQSENTKLEFNNIVGDIFVRTSARQVKGTRVTFSLLLHSKKVLREVFRQYSDDTFAFSKTKVTVRLFAAKDGYISRSQARRLVSGMDKFKTITLDFKNASTVGQAFADEVFRVFKEQHPKIVITPINMNKAVKFMVERTRKSV
jgi:anti-sigma regulatory factor (Ser/Thr protein kinase)